MFGTLMRMQPKHGKQDAVLQQLETWERNRGEHIDGPVAEYTYQLDDSNELVTAVVFTNRDTYEANADAPAQDKWYRDLVELLEEPPKFEDGEIVKSWTS